VNEEQKQIYQDKYYQAKQKGGKFYPDVIYKDLLVSFAIFIILVMLATFVGVANEPKADPSDTTYIPRPEWYFLFLFQMLKFFPGAVEWVGTAVIPGLAVLVLFLLPFIDRNPFRHFSKRIIGIGIMTGIVISIVALTIWASVTTPKQAEAGTVAQTLSEQILAGTDLYSVNCVECHGADGEGGEIKGVEGLEGYIMKPIHSQDIMYTRTDETFYNTINYGQPDLKMPPFGRQYGGALSPGDMQAIVAFIRYSWDDRAELPKEVSEAGAIPTLGPNQVASYEVNIAPIFKRYCVSCHRAGKKNNNFTMGSYDEVMKSGDHTPDVIPYDLNSNMIRMLNREKIEAGNPMPPTKALNPELIDIITRWVLAGAPNTAAEAKAVTPIGASPAITTTITAPSLTAIPEATVTPTP
jgi:menaquinol-cytochrome c reductase cytochrome b/c subunit